MWVFFCCFIRDFHPYLLTTFGGIFPYVVYRSRIVCIAERVVFSLGQEAEQVEIYHTICKYNFQPYIFRNAYCFSLYLARVFIYCCCFVSSLFFQMFFVLFFFVLLVGRQRVCFTLHWIHLFFFFIFMISGILDSHKNQMCVKGCTLRVLFNGIHFWENEKREPRCRV